MLKKILAFLVMLYAAVAMAAVDVNKATDAQLDGVKGIGPATSKAIMAERKKNGEFRNWDDLIARVKGMGEKRAVQLSGAGLTVNGDAYKAAAAKKDEKKGTRAAEGAKPAASARK